MNNDVEKYYEDMFELFATKGWKQIVKEAQEHVDGIKGYIFNTRDTNEFLVNVGRVEVLSRLLTLEEVTRTQYNMNSMEQADDASI